MSGSLEALLWSVLNPAYGLACLHEIASIHWAAPLAGGAASGLAPVSIAAAVLFVTYARWR